VIGSALANADLLKALVPTPPRYLGVTNGAAVIQEKEPVTRDLSGGDIGRAKVQMAPQHLKGAGAELDVAVLLRLSPILVSPQDPRLGYTKHTLVRIEIRYHEGDLFRGAQPGKKAELILSRFGEQAAASRSTPEVALKVRKNTRAAKRKLEHAESSHSWEPTAVRLCCQHLAPKDVSTRE
jgi:hypothetical protein